jgi:CheY-like chemotaxis protein
MVLADHGATSFDFAESEIDALSAALARRPNFIASDVQLTSGTGPGAVQAINAAMGPVPVIFITATPDACASLAQPGHVFSKPMNEASVACAFRQLIA